MCVQHRNLKTDEDVADIHKIRITTIIAVTKFLLPWPTWKQSKISLFNPTKSATSEQGSAWLFFFYGCIWLNHFHSRTVWRLLNSVAWVDYLLLTRLFVCCSQNSINLLWFPETEYFNKSIILSYYIEQYYKYVVKLLGLRCDFYSFDNQREHSGPAQSLGWRPFLFRTNGKLIQ